jgi:hypothetical protein
MATNAIYQDLEMRRLLVWRNVQTTLADDRMDRTSLLHAVRETFISILIDFNVSRAN